MRQRTKHRTSLQPWISQSSSQIIKCLNTARKSMMKLAMNIKLQKKTTEELAEKLNEFLSNH